MSGTDVVALVTALERDYVRIRPAPPYYPNDVELALLDAVLSIQARYGTSEDTGVRRSIKLYQASSPRDGWNDLTRLAVYTEDRLEQILNNRQKTARVSKAGAVISAAGRLVSAGVVAAADIDPRSPAHKKAYAGVRGLGPITWEYFLMCLGHDGVKADTLITRFVSAALGRKLSPESVAQVVASAARELQLPASALDHSIWRHMSAVRANDP